MKNLAQMAALAAFLLAGCTASVSTDHFNNPDKSVVIEALQNVDGIIEVAAATEDMDPNGQLGKTGGYTSAVFFIADGTGLSNLSTEELIMDYGTSAGGCIEVYATEEDAKERDEYLAGFDGTLLASGHLQKGTVVIRTSNDLSASQQQEIENSFIEAMENGSDES